MPPSPPNHDTPLPPPTAREEAALAWFARCQRGLSETQEIEFEHWLAADPAHATLFNELDGTWELLGHAAAASPVATSAAEARSTPSFSPGSRRGFARLRRLAWPLAAAAALAIAYLGWWRPAHYSGETATEVGGWRELRLPDGSLVTLNTDSAVAAAFSPAERRVTLERGEAHFTVAKNPDRPFIVEAGGVAVRAVGTSFNVRLAAQAVEVLVTEGRVRVDDAVSGKSLLARPTDLSGDALAAMAQPVLAWGRKVVVARPAPAVKAAAEPVFAETEPATVSEEEIRRELAWRGRRLDFELATLREIVAEFNRYSRHRLIVGDEELAEKRFGGSFRPDDQAGFVRMLQENFGVRAEESETATVLRSAR